MNRLGSMNVLVMKKGLRKMVIPLTQSTKKLDESGYYDHIMTMNHGDTLDIISGKTWYMMGVPIPCEAGSLGLLDPSYEDSTSIS